MTEDVTHEPKQPNPTLEKRELRWRVGDKAKGKRQKAEGRRQNLRCLEGLLSAGVRIPASKKRLFGRDQASGAGMCRASDDRMAKPFDIRERSFLFACDAVNAYPNARLEPRTLRIWLQFLAAATSGGSHLEEAEAASSRAHFVTLNRGALRELREARYWLRLIMATGLRGMAMPARWLKKLLNSSR